MDGTFSMEQRSLEGNWPDAYWQSYSGNITAEPLRTPELKAGTAAHRSTSSSTAMTVTADLQMVEPNPQSLVHGRLAADSPMDSSP